MDREIALQMPITESDEIHHSLADADDIEDVREEVITVGDVCWSLLRNPLQLFARWNWKSAVIGTLVRASIYFTVYQASKESWVVTLTAVGVEMVFRFVTTATAGSIIQSFRRATPEWLATTIISVILPTVTTSLIEFYSHYVQEAYFANIFAASENSSRQRTFAISTLLSVLSAMFSLYAMRRGFLLVGAGEETKSLGQDMKKMPVLVSEFVILIPVRLVQLLREGRVFAALGIFASFGLSVGTILAVTRGLLSWGYRSAIFSWVLLLVCTIIAWVVMELRRRHRIRHGSPE